MSDSDLQEAAAGVRAGTSGGRVDSHSHLRVHNAEASSDDDSNEGESDDNDNDDEDEEEDDDGRVNLNRDASVRAVHGEALFGDGVDSLWGAGSASKAAKAAKKKQKKKQDPRTPRLKGLKGLKGAKLPKNSLTPALQKVWLDAQDAYVNGNFQLSKQICQSLMTDAPFYPNSYQLMGLMHQDEGFPQLALEMFYIEANVQTRGKGLLKNVAAMALKLGDFKKACPAIMKAGAEDKNDPQIYSLKMQLFAKTNRIASGDTILKLARTKFPDNIDLVLDYGEACFDLYRPDKGVELYTKYIFTVVGSSALLPAEIKRFDLKPTSPPFRRDSVDFPKLFNAARVSIDALLNGFPLETANEANYASALRITVVITDFLALLQKDAIKSRVDPTDIPTIPLDLGIVFALSRLHNTSTQHVSIAMRTVGSILETINAADDADIAFFNRVAAAKRRKLIASMPIAEMPVIVEPQPQLPRIHDTRRSGNSSSSSSSEQRDFTASHTLTENHVLSQANSTDVQSAPSSQKASSSSSAAHKKKEEMEEAEEFDKFLFQSGLDESDIMKMSSDELEEKLKSFQRSFQSAIFAEGLASLNDAELSVFLFRQRIRLFNIFYVRGMRTLAAKVLFKLVRRFPSMEEKIISASKLQAIRYNAYGIEEGIGDSAEQFQDGFSLAADICRSMARACCVSGDFRGACKFCWICIDLCGRNIDCLVDLSKIAEFSKGNFVFEHELQGSLRDKLKATAAQRATVNVDAPTEGVDPVDSESGAETILLNTSMSLPTSGVSNAASTPLSAMEYINAYLMDKLTAHFLSFITTFAVTREKACKDRQWTTTSTSDALDGETQPAEDDKLSDDEGADVMNPNLKQQQKNESVGNIATTADGIPLWKATNEGNLLKKMNKASDGAGNVDGDLNEHAKFETFSDVACHGKSLDRLSISKIRGELRGLLVWAHAFLVLKKDIISYLCIVLPMLESWSEGHKIRGKVRKTTIKRSHILVYMKELQSCPSSMTYADHTLLDASQNCVWRLVKCLCYFEPIEGALSPCQLQHMARTVTRLTPSVPPAYAFLHEIGAKLEPLCRSRFATPIAYYEFLRKECNPDVDRVVGELELPVQKAANTTADAASLATADVTKTSTLKSVHKAPRDADCPFSSESESDLSDAIDDDDDGSEKETEEFPLKVVQKKKRAAPAAPRARKSTGDAKGKLKGASKGKDTDGAELENDEEMDADADAADNDSETGETALLMPPKAKRAKVGGQRKPAAKKSAKGSGAGLMDADAVPGESHGFGEGESLTEQSTADAKQKRAAKRFRPVILIETSSADAVNVDSITNQSLILDAQEISPLCAQAAVELLKAPTSHAAANILCREVFAHTDTSAERALPICSRFYNRYSESVVSCLLSGHANASKRRYGDAVQKYLDAYRLDPSQPLTCLCLVNMLFYMANYNIVAQRMECYVKALAFLSKYKETRMRNFGVFSSDNRVVMDVEDPDPPADALVRSYVTNQEAENGEVYIAQLALLQETFYNSGRAFHEVKLYSLAAKNYQEALSIADARKDLFCKAVRNAAAMRPLWTQVTRDAAHNLVIIYKRSNSLDLALDIMRKYLTID